MNEIEFMGAFVVFDDCGSTGVEIVDYPTVENVTGELYSSYTNYTDEDNVHPVVAESWHVTSKFYKLKRAIGW